MSPTATRILLVEDNPPEARLIAELFRDSGEPFEVTHAASLAAAEEHLRRGLPDAILLDLSLPDSQGLATLDRVLAAAPDALVLVLTGLQDEQLALAAIARGAEDYLVKGEAYGRIMVRALHYAGQRRRLHQQRQETHRRLGLLVQTSLRVMAARDPAELLGGVVEAARTLTDARRGISGHGFLEGSFRVGAVSTAGGAADCPPEKVFKIERGGVYMELLENCETLRLGDAELRGHPRWKGVPEGHAPLRGLLGARLVDARGAADGLIMVTDKAQGEFSEEDEALLKQLAAITSLALQHIEARTEAEQASLAKSRFLANMSHELRTPMNAILGMTELALGEELSSSVRDCLQTAKESADSLLELLNEILDFSRIEAGKLRLESTAFSLRELLDRTLKPLSLRAYEKGLELICDVRADVPERLLGDPLRLRQILVNLVGNAIKFTARGEVVVRVAAECEAASGQQPPIPSPSSVLHFSVSDTGIGIAPEDQEKILAAFTQADPTTTRRFGGTGLGLTIASSLVTLMGGRLWVNSLPEQGSTFHFTARFALAEEPPPEPAAGPDDRLRGVGVLVGDDNATKPVSQSDRLAAMLHGVGGAAAPVAGPARTAASRVTARPLRVLLAEDTRPSQKLVVRILQKRGHAVEVAENGVAALDLLRQQDFDVVLMDVQMPIMDGLQATQEIRRLEDPRKARIPVVAMTAHALRGDADRCLAAGMDAYLAKPVHAAEMIEIIERLAAGGSASGQGTVPISVSAKMGLSPSAPPKGEPPAKKSPGKKGAGPAPKPSAAVFNSSEALVRCAGQREILADMVSFYLEGVGGWIEELQAVAGAGAAPTLARLAHRLRGTLVYLAAPGPEELARRLEGFAEAGDMPGACATLETLAVELRRLQEALRQYPV